MDNRFPGRKQLPGQELSNSFEQMHRELSKKREIQHKEKENKRQLVERQKENERQKREKLKGDLPPGKRVRNWWEQKIQKIRLKV